MTHSASGRVALKCRFTKSGARVASRSCRVVKTFLRSRDTPTMPNSRMRRATWSRPMSWPARWAAFQLVSSVDLPVRDPHREQDLHHLDVADGSGRRRGLSLLRGVVAEESRGELNRSAQHHR